VLSAVPSPHHKKRVKERKIKEKRTRKENPWV